MTYQPYEKVVDFVIEQIEKHQQVPWEQPWINKDCRVPQNIRGNTYRGTNLFTLSFLQMLKGYKRNVWLTFKQALELEGNVKKGEKGVPVIFWQMLDRKSKKTVDGEDGDTSDEKIPFIRVYTVFNLEQCELPQKVFDKYAVEERHFEPIAEAEKIIANMPFPPVIVQDQIAAAFYKRTDDSVHIPEGKLFKKPEFYYSTMFHELVHATGHKSRLNREGVAEVESSDHETYSAEELVAELGSTFLCSQTQIEKEPAKDHIAYIENWVHFLKDHKKALIFAGQQAQKAIDFITKPKVPVQ